MSVGVAVYLFLSAAVVSVFAFLSIGVWSSAPGRERLARDRIALLKTLAEKDTENAARILTMLREDEQRKLERRQHEERAGYIVGGLIVMAVGVGLSAMLAFLAGPGAWSVGLIPLLIGCVLFGVGLAQNRSAAPSPRHLP